MGCSDAFCGAGLAAMFAWALALKAGWSDTKVELLLSGCSQYAAIASIADCMPLLYGTRILARLGLADSPDRGTRDCNSCSKALAPIHPNRIRAMCLSASPRGSTPPAEWPILLRCDSARDEDRVEIEVPPTTGGKRGMHSPVSCGAPLIVRKQDRACNGDDYDCKTATGI